MKPRSYTAKKRQEAVDTSRDRILAAARDVLQSAADDGFSIDAVARRAGVSRMTIYNQFESKAGLLEALFDSLAAHGPFRGMPDVFAQRDPRAALDEFIAIMGRFWTHSRRAHLKLRAAAIDDPELDVALQRRNERRRGGLTELVRRLGEEINPVVPRTEMVNVLFVLLSFDTFHALAGESRAPSALVPTVRRLIHATLGLKPAPRRARR